jgi:peptidoglycan hydrolase CwlO-like protein
MYSDAKPRATDGDNDNGDDPTAPSLLAAVERAEQSIREQQAELVRMMAELRQMYQAAQGGGPAAPLPANVEGASPSQPLANPDKEPAGSAPSLLELLDRNSDQVHKLKAEIAGLREELRAKNALIEELKRECQGQAPGAPGGSDFKSYEEELNEFHRQLEADRQALNEEIRQLQARNQELEQLTREAELEMSRERAEMARERARLERMRDELRAEFERTERDAEVRERLAPVLRLKDELMEQRQRASDAANTASPQGRPEAKNPAARLRSLFNPLGTPPS